METYISLKAAEKIIGLHPHDIEKRGARGHIGGAFLYDRSIFEKESVNRYGELLRALRSALEQHRLDEQQKLR